MIETDGFMVCPEHGDVFRHEGARSGGVIESAAMVPLYDGIERPKPGDPIRCPLPGCQRGMRSEIRRRELNRSLHTGATRTG